MLDLLNRFRQFDADRVGNDELIALCAFGKMLRAEYVARKLPAPAWLEDKLRTIERTIEMNRHDELVRRRRELLAQQQTDATPEERRAARAKELAEIDAALA